MKPAHQHRQLALGLALLFGATTLACGSKSDPPAAAPGSGAGGAATTPGAGGAPGGVDPVIPPGTVSPTAGACAKNDIQIAFSPMFSSYDGMHTFQVPAIVTGLAGSAISWSASDPSFVDMQPDASTGGVLITTRKAGVVDIIATAGTVCGVSKLTISQAEPDDWMAGDLRYNNGVVLVRPNRGNRDGGFGDGGFNRGDGGANNGPRDGGGNNGPRDGGNGNNGLGPVADGGESDRLACTNCHGPTANGPYKTVAHTPQQIGGFSDDQLKMIFSGIWPTGSGNPFDATITSQRNWESFHKWEMTDDEAAGVIIYLRALTPTPQTGERNFGGRGPGRGDGGAPRGPRDGGAGTD
jgi:hypothetical protein